MRSRAAAAILADRGFDKVYNMQGGIEAWEGLVASGVPESGMAHFGDAERPDELALLAWLLEDGSREFYLRCGEFLKDEDARKLFHDLARAEENHEHAVGELYRSFATGKRVEDSVPQEREHVMEGGMKVDEALVWARDKEVRRILEMAIGLEANAYDLYLKLERKFEGDAKKVFALLAGDEKKHLERLGALLERKV